MPNVWPAGTQVVQDPRRGVVLRHCRCRGAAEGSGDVHTGAPPPRQVPLGDELGVDVGNGVAGEPEVGRELARRRQVRSRRELPAAYCGAQCAFQPGAQASAACPFQVQAHAGLAP